MKCGSCGAEIHPGTQACPFCGLLVQGQSRQPESSIFSTILIAVGGAVVLCVALAGIAFIIFRTQFRASPAYQESLRMARASPEIQALLGQPIQEGWAIFAEMRHVYGSDFAEWTALIKGPKGSGRLEGVANRIGSSWHYSRLLFHLDGGEKVVDLTPPPARDPLLLGESKKKVLVVPLGPVSSAYLAWAPAYYKAKFGLSVEILPAISLNGSVWDAKRHQFAADNLIALMKAALPEKVKDQSTILIGVTSGDMYIQSFDWRYAINYRLDGRFAVLSEARLKPFRPFQNWNKALAISRLQKMLTKNIYLLCFDVPLSSDYTSAVSGGVMSPEEVDYMADQVIGAEGRWDSSVNGSEPTVSMTFAPGQDMIWNRDATTEPPTDVTSECFEADLKIGLLIQRKTDFYLEGDFPLQFVRVYRNKENDSRGFGVGTNDSLDMFIEGEPNKYLQVAREDGARVRFNRDLPHDHAGKQAYSSGPYNGRVFSYGTLFFFGFDSDIQTSDGWHYLFPFRRTAKIEQKQTALTGYSDPQGRRYEMVRNDAGDLLSITTPAGKWLHFESDEQHRYRRIEDSEGRVVNCDYDAKGRLVRVSDSEGKIEAYRYDDKNNMVAAEDGTGHVLMAANYTPDGSISSQTLSDGRTFAYGYDKNPAGEITQVRFTDPRGFVTLFRYVGKQYVQSLPSKSPDAKQSEAQPFLE